MVKYLLSLSFGLGAAPVMAKTVIQLSQKDVAERVLRDSYKAKEVNLNSQLTRYDLAKALGAYDLAFTNETYYEDKKLKTFSPSSNDRDQTWSNTLSLKKPFTTGTNVSFSYLHNTVWSEFNIANSQAATLPAHQTQDLMGIELSQNLWKNAFGISDRATVKAAEQTEQASELTRAVDLQNLVLDGIRLFWKAYVAQENFQEALNSRNRYEKVADTVKRKASMGYSNPGESSQIQAELEVRNQNVKNSSTDYLSALSQLVTLLKLPADAEIKFVVDEKQIPPMPALIEKDIQTLRSIRAAQLKKSAATETAKAADWKRYPDLSLVGKYYSNGVKEIPSDALADSTSGINPQFYVGLKLSYAFGSDLQAEEALNARLKKDIEISKYDRGLLEKQDEQLNTLRKVQSTYAVAQSISRQKELREKAAQDLQHAYGQGRVDIQRLIDALNAFFKAEVDYSRAMGDYMTALNEWSALRDELIPEQSQQETNL